MKAKKAAKRLARVEAMLSDIAEHYAGHSSVKDLIDSAKESVVRAKETVSLQAARAAKTLAAKAGKAKRRSVTAVDKKRFSLARKKEPAASKRKGAHTVTGRTLSKTA